MSKNHPECKNKKSRGKIKPALCYMFEKNLAEPHYFHSLDRSQEVSH